jgi:CRP/FNR family cyclic AMP-dependent transcriptional regulator
VLKINNDSPASGPGARQWLGSARERGFLGRLPDSIVDELVRQAQRVEYPKGGIGLRWDEEPKTAIVLRGSARAFLSTPDGAQVTTRYLRPGDMSGVFAVRRPHLSRGVQALEPTVLMLVSADRMKELGLAHPEFAWALIEEMTTVLNQTHRSLYIRALGSVRQRVASALLERAMIGTGRVDAGAEVAGTQLDLAMAAGTVREVVASVLRVLKKEGIIEVHRGRIVITDPARLERAAGEGMGFTDQQ